MTVDQIIGSLIGRASIASLLEGFAEKKAAWVNSGEATPEQVDALFDDFREMKRRHRLTPEEIDIDRYTSFAACQAVVREASTRVSKNQIKKTTVQKLPFRPPPLEGVDIVQDNDKAIIAVPHKWEDAKIIGYGTRWCVTMTDPETGRAHYARYANAGGKHYMAIIKGKAQPWIEVHPAFDAATGVGLKSGERPPSKVTCFKLGVELGLGQTEGGPGRYVMVPDTEYKVVYTTNKQDKVRNSCDEEIDPTLYLELTGFDINLLGENAFKGAQDFGIPTSQFLKMVKPEVWDLLGMRATTLRRAWSEGKPAEETTNAKWQEWWRQALTEMVDVPDNSDEMLNLNDALLNR